MFRYLRPAESSSPNTLSVNWTVPAKLARCGGLDLLLILYKYQLLYIYTPLGDIFFAL